MGSQPGGYGKATCALDAGNVEMFEIVIVRAEIGRVYQM